MIKSVNVVVTCTNRKTAEAPEHLRLRGISGRSPEDRAGQWIEHVGAATTPRISARDLYCGDHWTVVRCLPDASHNGCKPRLWVCSSGYGLIRYETEVSPYSATFSSGHEDSVPQSRNPKQVREERVRWWQTLARWKGPDPGEPRSLTELVRRHPRTPTLLVASPAYLGALQIDLAEALEECQSRAWLLIISSGLSVTQSLKPHVLPTDARLQKRLGGSMHSLNARIAHKVLSEFNEVPEDLRKLRKKYSDLLSRLGDLVVQNRTRMSDEEVKQFIKGRLVVDPKAKHSRLLRDLRDTGQACEQKRFADLFRSVKEGEDG